MNGWNGWMEWMNGMNEWMDGMDEWNGWMNGMDGWMDGRDGMIEWMTLKAVGYMWHYAILVVQALMLMTMMKLINNKQRQYEKCVHAMTHGRHHQTLLFRWIRSRDNDLLLAAATEQQLPDGLVERMTNESIEHVGIVQRKSVRQPADVDGDKRLTQKHVQFWHVAVTMFVDYRAERRHSCTVIKHNLQDICSFPRCTLLDHVTVEEYNKHLRTFSLHLYTVQNFANFSTTLYSYRKKPELFERSYNWHRACQTTLLLRDSLSLSRSFLLWLQPWSLSTIMLLWHSFLIIIIIAIILPINYPVIYKYISIYIYIRLWWVLLQRLQTYKQVQTRCDHTPMSLRFCSPVSSCVLRSTLDNCL